MKSKAPNEKKRRPIKKRDPNNPHSANAGKPRAISIRMKKNSKGIEEQWLYVRNDPVMTVERVGRLGAYGVPKYHIATLLGIDNQRLKDNTEEAILLDSLIDARKEEMRVKILDKFYAVIDAKDVKDFDSVAAKLGIFLCKSQFGMNETIENKHKHDVEGTLADIFKQGAERAAERKKIEEDEDNY